MRVTSGSVLVQGYGMICRVHAATVMDGHETSVFLHQNPSKHIPCLVWYSRLTESCSGCFTSIANVFSMIGTVGPAVTTIEARLNSVLEMDYDPLPDMPMGEVFLRGHTLFSDYYKRPDLPEEVFS
jgi:acyl-CoA synthetase (AMP-forming)/AMP-acid ligase II